MFRHRVSPFELDMVSLHPGEYWATAEDEILVTVLGSCVAVGLFDVEARAGGLNHFMLPGDLGDSGLVRSPNAKYGMYAMELLINDLLKLGARKASLQAKVFGGGSMLRGLAGAASKIPGSNIAFALEYLAKEGIPVIASDVGGNEARKIFFYARGGKVLLKRFGGPPVDLVEREEERYLDDLRGHDQSGPVLLFDLETRAPGD
jgi:chemotaxis protein CheD